MSRGPNNNAGVINTVDVRTLISCIGEPINSKFSAVAGDRSIRIIQLDLSSTGDVEKYRRLMNEPDKFEVINEMEHAGRYSVLLVVRYYQITDEGIGISDPEQRLEEMKKEQKEKKRKHRTVSRKKTPVRGKKKSARKGRIGFER